MSKAYEMNNSEKAALDFLQDLASKNPQFNKIWSSIAVGDQNIAYSMISEFLGKKQEPTVTDSVLNVQKRFKQEQNNIHEFWDTLGFAPGISLVGRLFKTFVDNMTLHEFCESSKLAVNYGLQTDQNETLKNIFSLNPDLIFNINRFDQFDTYIDMCLRYIEKKLSDSKKAYADRDKLSEVNRAVRILFLLLIWAEIHEIEQKKDKNDNSAWINTLKIGLYFMIGIGVYQISSHPNIIELIDSYMAGKKRSGGHEKKRMVREKENADLEPELQDILNDAENRWANWRQGAPVFHNIMMNKVIEGYEKKKRKRIPFKREDLLKKIGEISKKFSYSDFSQGEFRGKYKVSILCQAIAKDKYRLSLVSMDNTIEILNEILTCPTLYERMIQKKMRMTMTDEISELVKETDQFRKEKYSGLPEEIKNKIRRLNRLLLESIYPEITPKSRKDGLRRGWAGKK
jgi:hypothetical protein